MSIKNSSQLANDVITFFPNNTTEEISALDERNMFTDIIDSYVNTTDFFTGSASQYVAGNGTIQPFTNFISDTAYNAGTWNGVTTIAPSKNAVRDEIEALYTYAGALVSDTAYGVGWNGVTNVAPSQNAVYDAIVGIDLTPLWNINGNTLSSREAFGSYSGAYGWDFIINNSVKGGVENSAEWYWGTSAKFTSTDHSFKGYGNTSSTYGLQVQNSDNSARAWFRNDGLFSASGGYAYGSNTIIETSGSTVKYGSITDAKNVELWTGGIKVITAAYADFITFDGTSGEIFKRNGSEAFRITSDGVNPVVLMSSKFYNNSDANNVADLFGRNLYNNSGTQIVNWTTNFELLNYANFAVSNAGGSYGSGVGVMFLGNASTDTSSNPTGGVVFQAKSGRARVMETDGTLSYIVKATASTKTTAAAPYTNDGYVEVIINGTTVKLMTTA